MSLLIPRKASRLMNILTKNAKVLNIGIIYFV